MIAIRTLQLLVEEFASINDGAVGGCCFAFRETSADRRDHAGAAFINAAQFARHECDAEWIGEDRGDRLARSFIYLDELPGVETRGARFSSNPHGAVFVGLERKNASRRQSRIVDRLRSAAVELGETGFSSKPHRAVERLCNCAHAIGRQAVK